MSLDLGRNRIFAAAIGLELLLVGCVFVPGLDNHLAADDFSWIQTTARTLERPELFALPHNHFLRHTESLFFLACTVLGGMTSLSYQVGALLLHLANVVLVTLLVARVTGCRGGGIAGGLYWALNYRHVEVVLCPYAVADSLALGFGLGALLLLGCGRRWLALVLLVLALFGKSNAAVFPALAVLLVVELSPPSERRSRLLATIPLGVAAAGFLVAENVLGSSASYLSFQWVALGRLGDLAVSFLGPDFTHIRMTWFPDRETMVPPWLVVALLPAAALGVRKLPPALRVAVLWTTISVLPSLFVTHQTSRYHYLPLVGVAIAVGHLLSRWGAAVHSRRSTAGAVLLAVLAAAVGAHLLVGVTAEERHYDLLGAIHRDAAESFVLDVLPRLPQGSETMVLFLNGSHEPWVRLLETHASSQAWYLPVTHKWTFVRPNGVLGLSDTYGFVTFCTYRRHRPDPFVPLPPRDYQERLARGEFVVVVFDPSTRRYHLGDDRLRASLAATADPDQLYQVLQPGHFAPTTLGPTTLER